jgi:hypothetical protein
MFWKVTLEFKAMSACISYLDTKSAAVFNLTIHFHKYLMTNIWWPSRQWCTCTKSLSDLLAYKWLSVIYCYPATSRVDMTWESDWQPLTTPWWQWHMRCCQSVRRKKSVLIWQNPVQLCVLFQGANTENLFKSFSEVVQVYSSTQALTGTVSLPCSIEGNVLNEFSSHYLAGDE